MIKQGLNALSFIKQIRNVMNEIDLSNTSFPNTLSLGNFLLKGERRINTNRKRFGIPIPRFMFFSVTHTCNLSCTGCYAKSWKKGDGLSLKEIRNIINQAENLGTYIFVIAGGEPLTIEGLIPELSEKKDNIFLVFTNGTLINEKMASEIVAAGNIMPVISIDGPEEMNDQRRGKGVWKQATNSMTILKEKGGVFGFSTMLTHENFTILLSRKYLDLMYNFGSSLGFFIDYIPFPEDLNPRYILTQQDYKIKEELVKQARLACRPYIINFPPDEYKINNGYCLAARDSVHVNPDGWLEPCPYSHYASHNLLETPLVEALKSDFFRVLRNKLTEEKNISQTCQLFAMTNSINDIAKKTGAESKDIT